MLSQYRQLEGSGLGQRRPRSITDGYDRYRWAAERQQSHSRLQCIDESDLRSFPTVVAGAVTSYTTRWTDLYASICSTISQASDKTGV